MSKLNKFFLFINVVIVIVMVIVIATFVANAWTNPTANPPGGGGALYYSGGNIGIGTTGPGQKLTIDGTAPIAEIKSGGYLMLRPTANDYDFRLQAVAYRLDFLAGGDLSNPKMTILNGGNVGIGTTSPDKTLSVAGDIRVTGTYYSDMSTTSPFTINSTTKVINLNADLLDGFDSSAFGDATAANQTTILNRIGQATDASATTTTLFAGQHAIYDKLRGKSMYMTSATQDGSHNCDDVPGNCCATGYHLCYAPEMFGRDLEITGTGRNTAPGGKYGDVRIDICTATADCTGWTTIATTDDRVAGIISGATNDTGMTFNTTADMCDDLKSQWCCMD